jgi:hypothetical protein
MLRLRLSMTYMGFVNTLSVLNLREGFLHERFQTHCTTAPAAPYSARDASV